MEPITIAGYFDILAKSQKVYSKCLDPVCKKWSLTRNELDILLFLYNNPSFDRAADIVARRGIAKSHVSLSVSSLEERGLLLRQFSSEDRRTAHLQLTEQGLKIAAEGKEFQELFFTQLYAGIPPEDLAHWQETAQKIRENVENLESESK